MVRSAIDPDYIDGDKRYVTLTARSNSAPEGSYSVAWKPRGAVVCEVGAIIGGKMVVRRPRQGGQITFPGRENCYGLDQCRFGVPIEALWVSVKKG